MTKVVNNCKSSNNRKAKTLKIKVMMKVQKALRIILRDIKTLDSEVIQLTDTLGRVLAEDIYSPSNIPGFDNSAMDGYALRSLDSSGAACNKPKILEVIDECKAGDISRKQIKHNQAIRIMTGAMIPHGADCVIMVENTNKIRIENKDFVEILSEVGRGENIRRSAEDIKKGELVIRKGTVLQPSHIGILASLGISNVNVSRKPKIAILATGDELVDVGEKLKPGKLHSSNTYTLYTQIKKRGGIPKNLGIAKDTPHQLEKKIQRGLDCDMILTSGGVSVGDYDLVKDVLAKMGTDIRFWKVAMRPGKPLVFGHIRSIPIFGLPGNPVSSMVSFELFVMPAILKMLGQNQDGRKEVEAVLEEDITKKKGLRYFLRARTFWQNGTYHTLTTGAQGSGILKSMALANSLIVLPEDKEVSNKGKKVTVRFLE